jgi:hypothetical protein
VLVFNRFGPKVAVDQSCPDGEINNRMAGSFAFRDKVFLQTETTMVGRDSYLHARSFLHLIGCRLGGFVRQQQIRGRH